MSIHDKIFIFDSQARYIIKVRNFGLNLNVLRYCFTLFITFEPGQMVYPEIHDHRKELLYILGKVIFKILLSNNNLYTF